LIDVGDILLVRKGLHNKGKSLDAMKFCGPMEEQWKDSSVSKTLASTIFILFI
jgi:hypothetical protein